MSASYIATHDYQNTLQTKWLFVSLSAGCKALVAHIIVHIVARPSANMYRHLNGHRDFQVQTSLTRDCCHVCHVGRC
jgi:hypothetical protein